MSILVLAEHAEGALVSAVLNTVTAAAEIAADAGSDVHLLVAGSDCAGVAEQASKVAGVAKVLVADDARYDHALAEPVADLLASIAKGTTATYWPQRPNQERTYFPGPPPCWTSLPSPRSPQWCPRTPSSAPSTPAMPSPRSRRPNR